MGNLLQVRGKFVVSFFDILDILYRLIQFTPVKLTTIIHLFPLFGRQRVIRLFCDPGFEGEGNLVGLLVRVGNLVLLPTGFNDLFETVIPGVREVSLRGCEFSLFGLRQLQIRFDAPGGGTRVVVEPGANPL